MSDTDDTDDLLLIPPDFFLVHSEPDPPYYNIVENLIKQVSNLQNRIENIETTSDVSLGGSNLDNSLDLQENSIMSNPFNHAARRYYSHDNLYSSTSAQNTPQKPQAKIKLSSLPNSPIVDRFSPKQSTVRFARSPQKSDVNNASKEPPEDREVLHEIDTFISNVKTIQRNHAVRNLQNDFDAQRIANNKDTNESHKQSAGAQNRDRDVQETIDQLHQRSQEILREKEKSKVVVPEKVDRGRSWKCGENIGSVPNYNRGIRSMMFEPKSSPVKFNELLPNFQPTPSSSTDFTSYSTLDKSTDSSSDSTQLTAYYRNRKQEDFYENSKKHEPSQKEGSNQQSDNILKVDSYKINQERKELLHSPLHDTALSVLEMHQKLLESTNNGAKEGQIRKKRGINTLSDTLGLLSLADIWGATQSPSKIGQKLQEEKLRRQHCEMLIQDLQNKNLELQQKLAVAVKVDETKNNTIQQFREALEKVAARMEKLNEEKSTWEKEVIKLKNQHSLEIETANQKISYHEKEASKALNLAHSNQEKILSLERRCSELLNQLEDVETKFKEVEENYTKEIDKNKQLVEIISQKEIELKDNKSILNNAREEVSQSRKAVEVCQSEFSTLKNECAILQTVLKEERNIVLNLSEQKKKLLNDIQTYKNNEKILKEALDHSKAKLESTKLEVRNFYQGQLEIIVENKRKEMQSQLDTERQHNLEELKRKEMSMARTAANHIKQISEKCALETKLLEEKHLEEIRLYQMQLSQYKTEIGSLQAKLANLPEKRAQIAKQLQKVMETQWNEALKMINSSPSSLTPDQQLFDNMNSLQPKQAQNKLNEEVRQTRAQTNVESASDFDETPVSSRGPKQSESEIQKYINMLLNRPSNTAPAESQDAKKGHNHDRATWHPGDQENQHKPECSKNSFKERKIDKPPWK